MEKLAFNPTCLTEKSLYFSTKSCHTCYCLFFSVKINWLCKLKSFSIYWQFTVNFNKCRYTFLGNEGCCNSYYTLNWSQVMMGIITLEIFCWLHSNQFNGPAHAPYFPSQRKLEEFNIPTKWIKSLFILFILSYYMYLDVSVSLNDFFSAKMLKLTLESGNCI